MPMRASSVGGKSTVSDKSESSSKVVAPTQSTIQATKRKVTRVSYGVRERSKIVDLTTSPIDVCANANESTSDSVLDLTVESKNKQDQESSSISSSTSHQSLSSCQISSPENGS